MAKDITAHKLAEKTLLEREESLYQFVKQAPAPIAMLDANLNYIAASDRWLSEHSPEDRKLIGRNMYEVFPDIPERWKEIHRRCLAGAVESSEADPWVRSDGGTNWVRWEIGPWRKSDGAIGGLVVFSEDITRIKGMEVALAKLQRLSAEAERIGKVGGWELNIDTGRVTWTKEVYRLHEVGADFDPNLENGVNFYAPESKPIIEQVIKRATETGAGFDLELKFITAKGNPRDVRAIGEADLKNRRVYGFFQDITELKKAEAALRESEKRLRKLTDMVPGVVYEYRLYPDGRSCFPISSSGMKDIYEVTPEEVREDAAVVFGRIHPDDLKRTSDAIFESARTLKNFNCELRMVLPRQGLRWRVSAAVPERLPDGSTLWYGIITDITELKKREEDVRRLNRLHIIQSAISKAIVKMSVPQALLKLACRIIVEQGGFRMAWIGLLDDATKEVRVAASAGHTGDYLEQLKITLKNTPRGRGPTAAAIRKASPVLVGDIALDPRMAVWRTAALRHGYRSSGAFPLKINGKAIGTLNLYSAKPGTFTGEEVALLTDLAASLSLALENHKHEQLRVQAEEALKKHSRELETAKKRAEDKNTALREVLEEIEAEKNRLKDEITTNANKVLLPIIKKLQLGGGAARKHAILLEKSLKNLASSFGRRLTEKDFGLTPKELEICNMVRSGLAAKEIAGLLDVSLLTVNKHRGNIRNKLGLANKKANLASFLQKL